MRNKDISELKYKRYEVIFIMWYENIHGYEYWIYLDMNKPVTLTWRHLYLKISGYVDICDINLDMWMIFVSLRYWRQQDIHPENTWKNISDTRHK